MTMAARGALLALTLQDRNPTRAALVLSLALGVARVLASASATGP